MITGLAKSPGFVTRRPRSPFPEMMQLHNVLNDLFAGPFTGETAQVAWQPPVDIFESEDEIVIKMELPEVKKEDIQVSLDDQTLTISGERHLENEEKKDGYHRIERTYGQFARSFTIPTNVNNEALRAECRDGVLKVHLPKKEEARPRTITIG
jgi:HSP20 family protein